MSVFHCAREESFRCSMFGPGRPKQPARQLSWAQHVRGFWSLACTFRQEPLNSRFSICFRRVRDVRSWCSVFTSGSASCFSSELPCPCLIALDTLQRKPLRMLLGLGNLLKQCLGKCSVYTGSPLNPLHIRHRCRGLQKLVYHVQMRNTCSAFAICGSWRVLNLWRFRIVTFSCLLISTFNSAREKCCWCSMLQPGRSFSSSSTLPCPDLSARETSWRHVCSQSFVAGQLLHGRHQSVCWP